MGQGQSPTLLHIPNCDLQAVTWFPYSAESCLRGEVTTGKEKVLC